MSDLNMPGTRKVCRIQLRFDNGTLTFTYMLLSEYKKKSTPTKELVTTNAQECSKSKATENRNHFNLSNFSYNYGTVNSMNVIEVHRILLIEYINAIYRTLCLM